MRCIFSRLIIVCHADLSHLRAASRTRRCCQETTFVHCKKQYAKAVAVHADAHNQQMPYQQPVTEIPTERSILDLLHRAFTLLKAGLNHHELLNDVSMRRHKCWYANKIWAVASRQMRRYGNLWRFSTRAVEGATTLRPGENCHYKALKEFHYRISAIRSGRNSRKTACTLCS